MTNIVFLRTRYVYESYSDLIRLFELAGFPSMYVDELDISQPGVYITSPVNGELRPHIDNQRDKPHNAHVIVWNLERPSGSGGLGQYGESNRQLLYQRYADEIWVSDRRLADETSLRFVVLGSHPGLGSPGPIQEKKYSFVHMSYMVGRRQSIYKHFITAEIAPNCWGAERDKVLRESRFALNVHQDQYPFQEPLRLALFAAYGLPIITETIYDSYPWSDEFCKYGGYDSLVRMMREALSLPYEGFAEMGMRARKRMCEEFEFGKMVREAVEQSVGSDWR